MNNRSESQVWEDFMGGDYAQSEIQRIKKSASGQDRNKLYNVDPKNKTELSESVKTMGVSSGGGSIVGGGDSKALYTTKSSPVSGDSTVEGLEAIHDAMMEVANRTPTGKQGNSLKQFTKAGQMQMMNPMMNPMMSPEDEEETLDLNGDEGDDLESILAQLEEEDSEDSEDSESLHEPLASRHLHTASLAAKRADAVSLLKELVKIANDLDAQGQHADAAEIDAVIKDEVKTLAASKKK